MDLKEFNFGILKQTCAQENSTEECKQNLYNFEKKLFQGEPEILKVLESHGNLEEAILIWHIATTLCYKQENCHHKVIVGVKQGDSLK
ncbi:hypothetical protein SUGI_1036360 [Cryptomeria japonica]|nr:hypothetical protein SUGI_1036360 [Cryptomeria japonica]